ncbi:putative membrane protein [Clostridium bornimense]|uniref:Putative membrane protein n=1 Tax=Clostridium bornimense TaxID=1216932 RepID=W6RYJ0_9CLOT|nr:hypothetical protein [Clostridium bornimense]CDM69726.1 putative membrane protein [Clostridium bornimense]
MGCFIKLVSVYLLITVLINNIFMKQARNKNAEKIKKNNIIYIILTVAVAFLLSFNNEEFSVIRVSTILIEVIMTNILINRGICHLIYRLSTGKKRRKYDVKKEMISVISFFVVMALLVILLGTIKQLSLYYIALLIGILLFVVFINIKNLIREFAMIKKI